MMFKDIFNELYEFIKSRDSWRSLIIRHRDNVQLRRFIVHNA